MYKQEKSKKTSSDIHTVSDSVLPRFYSSRFTKGYVHYNWLVLLSFDAQPALNNVGLFSIL